MIDREYLVGDINFVTDAVVAYSSNRKTRWASSSGGVVSELIRYLFSIGFVATAIRFTFTPQNYYSPELIYNFDDYNITGSIYHNINLIAFLRRNITAIEGRIVVVCLPCQVSPIRHVLNRHRVQSFIICLTCSAQMRKGATTFFLNAHKIDRNMVTCLQYRGKGWPSGITITMDDRREISFRNTRSDWECIFHSYVFHLSRCLRCNRVFGCGADINVGDPWLSRYKREGGDGCSMVLVCSGQGQAVLDGAVRFGAILIRERLTTSEVIESQLSTFIKKYVLCRHRRAFRFLFRMIRSNIYVHNVFKYPLVYRYHYRIVNKIIFLVAQIRS